MNILEAYDLTGSMRDAGELAGCLQEHVTGLRPGPGTGQVRDQRLADVGRQRQPVLTASLSTDDDLAAAPVNVVQLQRGHLDRAQAEPGQQHQDRVVANADRPLAGSVVQQPLGIAWRHRRRHRGETLYVHWGHRAAELDRFS